MSDAAVSRYHVDTCEQEAREAGLRYVADDTPGIVRRRAGRGFAYIAPGGEQVTKPQVLERIRLLAIPPAYRDVWICPAANGHLQATGRDDRNRKQYRYHPGWTAYRNATKFSHLVAFGEALPAIREAVERDLRKRSPAPEKVMALVTALLDETAIRVGNDVYARENGSYGLTTLRKKHVKVEGERIHFEFVGKRGKKWRTTLRNARLARAVRHCEELPGYTLFQYVGEDGERRPVRSEDVNAYLREISGQPFTAKDFRTWNATLLAVEALLREPAGDSESAVKRQVAAAVREVAEAMGHTPAICRKSYIAPSVIDAFGGGTLHGHFSGKEDREAAVIRLLRASGIEA